MILRDKSPGRLQHFCLDWCTVGSNLINLMYTSLLSSACSMISACTSCWHSHLLNLRSIRSALPIVCCTETLLRTLRNVPELGAKLCFMFLSHSKQIEEISSKNTSALTNLTKTNSPQMKTLNNGVWRICYNIKYDAFSFWGGKKRKIPSMTQKSMF